MNPYSAPLDEIRFVLRNLSDIALVKDTPVGETLADDELTDAILNEASRFAQEVLAPTDVIGDTDGAKWTEEGVTLPAAFRTAYRQFVDADWNKVAMPAEYGGQGMPTLLCVAIREIFAASNKSFCMGTELGTTAVAALGFAASDEVKSLFLPKLVSGEWAATMNLTEPQAGSDVGALRTRARRQPDGTYRLTGQKIFISFGDHNLTENIVHLVLARTPDAPAGSRGISLFVVPKFLPVERGLGARNDVHCTGIEHKVGSHGSPTCTMVFGDQGEGAVGWIVGEENKGLQYMFVMMNEARLNVGLESVAVSERAYQQALAYARERVQGKPVGAEEGEGSLPIMYHPDVSRMLLAMRSQVEAMRGLAYIIAASQDLAEHHPDPSVRAERQAFVDLMIPVFKGGASENAIDVTRTAIQVHGGSGYVLETGISQPLRDILICPIYEGTTGIQAQDFVSRKIMRDSGKALQTWLSQVYETALELGTIGNGQMGDVAEELQRGIDALKSAAAWVIALYPSSTRAVLATSVPFLRLAGVVAGGWQMVRGAIAAHQMLEEGRGNQAFLRAKLASARFYAMHVLPQAPALARTVTQGGESALAGVDLAQEY